MKSGKRSTSFGLRAVGIAGAAVLLVALLVQGAGARPAHHAVSGHQCLVMTGSGAPAFARNFTPYPATGLPSGAFVKGAFYEPLVITTAAGGGHEYPWLARQ